MDRDYREHLDASSLRLLAETTGYAHDLDEAQLFQSRPYDIQAALGSPEATKLLDLRSGEASPGQHRILQLAIAVHRTAQQICQAGWSATDNSLIDLDLVQFAGQTEHQHFVVGLLASYLNSPSPVAIDREIDPPTPGTAERLMMLIELCGDVSDTEHPGALRLLGDEALFSASVFPARTHECRVDDDLLTAVQSVLPKAVLGVFDDVAPDLRTMLDVHLTFGSIWYRMASENLLFKNERQTLDTVATEFATIRRFLVRVAQGPLQDLRDSLYPDVR